MNYFLIPMVRKRKNSIEIGERKIFFKNKWIHTCNASLPNVRIQTHIFVATKCIRPMRAINLNLLIIKREYVNIKYICENVKAACRIGFTPIHL